MGPTETVDDVVSETRDYYDGPADAIYRHVWGDNVHMGTFAGGVSSLQEAMAHTNRIMAERAGVTPGSRVLDLGCGYGGAGLYLAEEHGCEVVGHNISDKELELARQRAAEAGLGDRVSFEYGDFHDIPAEDQSFDVAWSQEALLHAADKHQVLEECHRVLRPGGRVVISDLLVDSEVPESEREALYERVHSPAMWEFDTYLEALSEAGFEPTVAEDWSANVVPTYEGVLRGVLEHRAELEQRGVPDEQLDDTIEALQLWIEAARAGKIGQGLFVGVRD